MSFLHALRRTRTLSRLVLVWFVLSVTVATASPLLHAQQTELVCSAGGAVKLVVKTADGGTRDMGAGTMDCAMCLPAGAPPPTVSFVLPPHAPLAHAVQPLVAAEIAARTAAPLDARGPPSLS